MMFFAFLAQTIRIAMPYLFASAGGVVSERAGLIGLTLEGYMLIAAFCAALGSYFGGSPWLGVLAGIGGGAVADCCTACVAFGIGRTRLLLASRSICSRSASRDSFCDSPSTAPPIRRVCQDS